MNLLAARYIDRWAGVAVHLGLHAVGRATGRRLPPPGATTPPAAGRTWARPRRVLAIKFYGLGNLVLILPTLAALRAAVPEVEIDFLTLPGNEALLEQSGLVARVLTVEVATFPRFARAVARLVQALRARGYDTVLDFEQFLKVSGIFGFLSGAPELIGFDTEGQHRGWLYTTRVVSTDSVHTRDLFLRLAAPLGVPSGAAPAWRLPVADADRARVRALLPSGGAGRSLVVMHPGTGESYNRVALKRWEIERFAAVADALAERHGAVVAFTGHGEAERALVAQATRRLRHPALDACDRLGVGELAALVAEATVVLTGDTSVMHRAGAVCTPGVALHGPAPPALYGPRAPRGVEVVYHLAAGQGMKPQLAAVSEVEIHAMNVAGTANVLAAARAEGVRKVVFVSSSGVYGVPTTVPVTEDHPERPLGAYGRSKIEAERLCLDWAGGGRDVTVLRPMSLFGPHMTGVFVLLFDWVQRGKNVYLLGRGQNRVQMVSAEDVAEACRLAAETPAARGLVLNLGADGVPTVRAQVEALIRHAGSRSRIVPVPAALVRNAARVLRPFGLSPIVPEHYLVADATFILDTTRARTVLGWTPRQDNVALTCAAYDWYAQHAHEAAPRRNAVLALLDAFS